MSYVELDTGKVFWNISEVFPKVDQIQDNDYLNAYVGGRKTTLHLKRLWEAYSTHHETKFETLLPSITTPEERKAITLYCRKISETKSSFRKTNLIPDTNPTQTSSLFRSPTKEEWQPFIDAGITIEEIEVLNSHGFNDEELKALKGCFNRWDIYQTDLIAFLFFDLYQRLIINEVNNVIKMSTAEKVDIVEQMLHEFFHNFISFNSWNVAMEEISHSAIVEEWSSQLIRLQQACDEALNAELSDDLRISIQEIRTSLTLIQHLIVHEHSKIFCNNLTMQCIKNALFPGEDWEEKGDPEKILKQQHEFFSFLNICFQNFKTSIKDTTSGQSYLKSILQIIELIQEKMAAQSMELKDINDCNDRIAELSKGLEKEKDWEFSIIVMEPDNQRKLCKKENKTTVGGKILFTEWRKKLLLTYSNLEQGHFFIKCIYKMFESLIQLKSVDGYVSSSQIQKQIKKSISYIRGEESFPRSNIEHLEVPSQINEDQNQKCQAIIKSIRKQITLKMCDMKKKLRGLKSEIDVLSFEDGACSDFVAYAGCLEKIEPSFNEIVNMLPLMLEQNLILIKEFFQDLDPGSLESKRTEWVEYFKNIFYYELREFIVCLIFPRMVRLFLENNRMALRIVHFEYLIDERLVPYLSVEGIETIIDELITPLPLPSEVVPTELKEAAAELKAEETKEVLSLPEVFEVEETKEPVSLVVSEAVASNSSPQAVPSAHKKKKKEKKQKVVATASSSSSVIVSRPEKKAKDERIFHSGNTIPWVLRKLHEEGFLFSQADGSSVGSHLVRIKASEEGVPVTIAVGGKNHQDINDRTAKKLNDIVIEKKMVS